MEFKKIKWKMALPMLALALLAGCEKGSSPIVDSTDKNQNITNSTSNVTTAESVTDVTASAEESVHEKTKLEIIMEMSDQEEKAVQLYDLLMENMEDSEVAEALVSVIISKQFNEQFVLPYVSEEFRTTQKSAYNDKIKEHQCEFARYIYTHGYWDNNFNYKPDKSKDYVSIVCYDENGRVTYAPVLYEYHCFDYTEFAKEVVYYYDEEGRWVGTDRLYNGLISGWQLYNLGTDGWEPRTDRIEYDGKGRLNKYYTGNELYAKIKYDGQGCLSKIEFPPNQSYTYVYGKDGYLTKVIEDFGYGDKDEMDYEGLQCKAYLNPCLDNSVPNFMIDISSYEEDDLMIEPWHHDNFVKPTDFGDKNIIITSCENDDLEISILHQYNDGFMDINMFRIASHYDLKVLSDYSYSLFYYPE